MRFKGLVVASAMLFAASAHAKGPYGAIQIGHWKGGAYTADATGMFSHCVLGAQYLNGIYLNVAQNARGTWTIGFANKDFHLTVRNTIPVDVTLDGQSVIHLFGTAVTPTVFVAEIPNETLLEQFRKAHLMVAQTRSGTAQFHLTDIEKVIPAVSKCTTKAKLSNFSAFNTGDFSPPPAPPPGSVPPSQSPAGTASGGGPTLATTSTDAYRASGNSALESPKLIQQSGTGFVVSTNGHLVTNNHVIDGCVGEIRGNAAGQAPATLRVISRDAINDLALLQATGTFSDFARIRGASVHPGDAIVAIGYPLHGLLTSDVTVTTGIVSSLSGLLNDTRFLQISAGVQHGNSGGPLLDSSGQVVGVVTSKINALKFAKATGDLPENINFAIKTAVLRNFLDSSAVAYETADAKSELKTSDIVQTARAYTMLISCTAKPKN